MLTVDREPLEIATHPFRERVNAWFFHVLDGYAHRKYRVVKREMFGGLPRTILEIGAGDGANFRYLTRGTRVIALEPNVHMHGYLREAGRRHGVTVDIRVGLAERIPLPDASVEAVICSLVLCTVKDPERALAEVRRVLRPGGRLWCIEHVAAPAGTLLANVQRWVHRPWRWLFEGCETRRDTGRLLREAGFASVEITPFTLRTAFVPIRPQIAAVALR
ncbi:MAG TPA: class I SAM-dependent methyltransferase [Anaeromyxobacteraceae bacterium]|nr:class I SAM-dependent methyltransferase [Anaeromyxobacteraceae bacterium]